MSTIEQGPTDGPMSDHDAAVRRVANALHRLNDAVIGAVNAGVTVELMRASRFHNEEGAWGDMLVPIIHKKD